MYLIIFCVSMMMLIRSCPLSVWHDASSGFVSFSFTCLLTCFDGSIIKLLQDWVLNSDARVDKDLLSKMMEFASVAAAGVGIMAKQANTLIDAINQRVCLST